MPVALLGLEVGEQGSARPAARPELGHGRLNEVSRHFARVATLVKCERTYLTGETITASRPIRVHVNPRGTIDAGPFAGRCFLVHSMRG